MEGMAGAGGDEGGRATQAMASQCGRGQVTGVRGPDDIPALKELGTWSGPRDELPDWTGVST